MTTPSLSTTEQTPLPAGWRWARLGEVCEPTETRDPRREPDAVFKYVDITSVDNISKKITVARAILGKDAPSRARQVIRAGDVIVSTTRPNLNAVARVAPELDNQICSTGFCIIRPNHGIDSDFLFAFVQTLDFVNELSEAVKGALYPAVTDAQVRSVAIPLPPLPEQRRIAVRLNEILAEIARARAAAQAALAAANALPAALLRAAFESDEAKGWKGKQIGAITSVTSGGTPSRGNPDYFRGKIPWVKTTELQDNSIDDTEEHINEDGLRDSAAKIFPIGTILVALYGQGQTRGRTAILRVEAATNQACAAILPNPKELVPQFLQLWFRHKYLEIRAYAENHNNTQANLSGGYIKSLEPPLPSLEIQIQTIARLSAQMENARQVRASAQAQLDAINSLPAVYLRRAFRGEL